MKYKKCKMKMKYNEIMKILNIMILMKWEILAV